MRQQQPSDFQDGQLIQLWVIYQERFRDALVFSFHEAGTFKHRRSQLVQGGLEIPVTVCIERDSTSKNILVLERYKKLVNENYKEPIKGNFDDCTKDILRDLYESSDSDEDDTSSVD